MESAKEIFLGIGSSIKDRLLNPAYVAFLISWGTINFRLFLVLAGEGKWLEKIEYIDSKLYPDRFDWWWKGLIYPAILATIFIIASPFLYRLTMTFLKKQEKDTIKRLLDIANETPLTIAEAEAMRARHLSARTKWAAEKAQLQAEIDGNSPMLAKITNENEILSKENALLQTKLEDADQQHLLLRDNMKEITKTHEQEEKSREKTMNTLADDLKEKYNELVQVKKELASKNNQILQLQESHTIIMGLKNSLQHQLETAQEWISMAEKNTKRKLTKPVVETKQVPVDYEIDAAAFLATEYEVQALKAIENNNFLSPENMGKTLGWNFEQTQAVWRNLIEKQWAIPESHGSPVTLTPLGSRISSARRQ